MAVSNTNIDITRNLGNDNYRFIIAGLRGGPISGVMQNEMAIGGGNEFSSAKEAVAGVPIIAQAQGLLESAGKALNISGRSSLLKGQTRLVWNESAKPQFTIDMFFYSLSTDETPSVLDKMKRIQSAVLPTSDGAFLKAPLGYKIKGSGTVTLQVGKWFVAKKLIVKSTNLVPSKEVMSTGMPLYVAGSITLEPFELITIDEFESYIKL